MATMVANDRPFEPVGAAIGSADNKSSCDGAAGTLNATVPVEQRPGLFDPLPQSVDDPVEFGDRQHRAAPRQAALGGLAEPYVHRPVGPALAHVRVGPQIGDVEATHLVAS